ncbi:MAG: type II toxin-antitoxin system RelE/ParE family toxin [Planctomycetes bacterium]|nr:type II toxin-antitoxin system RelE/ParE family toxin [Planctomycetota bacterium]
MRHQIILSPEAEEDYRRLSARDRAEVRAGLEVHLRHEPEKASKSRIKRLRGLKRPQFRLRIADIRVFYDVDDDCVQILAIIPKADAADWLARQGEPS